MLLYKQKKNQAAKGTTRFLISVTVLGSAGPIRFVVNEEELVAAVIDTALKSYAREGRLPVLGSDLNNFILYCPIAGTQALLPWETIGSVGVRNFILCKKPHVDKAIDDDDDKASGLPRKGLEFGGDGFTNLAISRYLLIELDSSSIRAAVTFLVFRSLVLFWMSFEMSQVSFVFCLNHPLCPCGK